MTQPTLSILASYDTLKDFFSSSPDIVGVSHWADLTDTDLTRPQRVARMLGTTLLCQANNRPNAEGDLINDQPPILAEDLSDPRVVKRTFFLIHNGEILFNHQMGICRGMVTWFLYLHLKTSHLFSSPRVHMTALCRRFEQGGGREATLLQTLDVHNGKLLDLKIGTQPSKSETPFEEKEDCVPIAHIPHPSAR